MSGTKEERAAPEETKTEGAPPADGRPPHATDARRKNFRGLDDKEVVDILSRRFKGLRVRRQREVRKAAEGVKGTVKWFNVQSGYGFVCRDDTGEDVFVHHSSIVKPNPKQYQHSLEDGERVRFDVGETQKGLEAINVTAEDGGEVQGSRFAWDLASIPPPHVVRYLFFLYFPRPIRREDRRVKQRSVSEGESERGGGRGERRRRRPQALTNAASDVEAPDVRADKPPPRRRSNLGRPRRRYGRRSEGQKMAREDVKDQDVDMRSDAAQRPKDRRHSHGGKSGEGGEEHKETSADATGLVRKTVQNIEQGAKTHEAAA